MSYASYEEMEDAVSEEYREKISELEEQAVELHREIDALKHEVNIAEEEFKSAVDLIAWMRNNYPEILTTYEVTQRMED
jgi:uncharacterized coiled-coil DUF342 family protein